MKGIIIAAGYGTRFLPVTKTIPKEMLPLINKPSIDFIIDEFIASGIREILIITSRRKKVLDDYFDRDMELESVFAREGSKAKLNAIKQPDADIFFKRQSEMRGTGHAILQARPFIGDEPFVVAYPDDLHFGDVPLASQLISTYHKTGCSVLSALHNPPDLERYGVLAIADDGLHVTDIIEKPAPGKEPSREASIGRYLYTHDFFSLLKEGWDAHLASGSSGEYFHIYALKKLMDAGKVVFKSIEGERLDTGSPAGYLRAIIKYSMSDPELEKVLREECGKLCRD
ncbi:MAG: UTP--glucose-1-phosphate uridylyltransferase [Spirochaetia bacterium]|jgi:UTP--glucose-1-phosphate uridylyltransferase|nr:UTP--glucose-1-phosphate uridylyltransferase [Spirochaetia bacterium]